MEREESPGALDIGVTVESLAYSVFASSAAAASACKLTWPSKIMTFEEDAPKSLVESAV